MFCTKCGAKNPEDATFCYKCGNEIYKTIEKLSDKSDKSHSIDFINDNKKVSVSKNIEKEPENELTTPEERELSPVLKAVFELFIVGKERREVISRNDFWLSQVVLIIPIIILLLICYGLQWVGMVYTFYILSKREAFCKIRCVVYDTAIVGLSNILDRDAKRSWGEVQ